MTASSRSPSFPAGPALTIFALGLAAAATAGCHRHVHGGGDRPLAVSSRLDCPESQGDLHRTDEAADGRSCRYAGPDGQEVTLAYLALDGRAPQEALRPTEADLRALVPASAAPEPGSLRPAAEDGSEAAQADVRDGDEDHDEDRAQASAHDAVAGAPTPPKPPEPPQIDRSWTAGSHGGDHERVRVNLPFLHVDADGDGRARVRAFGVDVDADHDGAVVSTPGGGHIDARHGGAEMRFGSVSRDRADLVYILASKTPGPQGFRSAAYVAKGPAQGPLVLAVSRSRNDEHGVHDDELREIKRLVNRNVRGAHGGGGFDFDID